MSLPKSVELNDSTMRDGEQTIGVAYTDEEKLLIARKLDELGVGSIELSVFMKPELIKAICDLDLTADIICMGFSGWAKNWKEIIDAGIDVGLDIVSLSHGSFYSPWGIRSREENPHIATEDDWIGSAVEVVDRHRVALANSPAPALVSVQLEVPWL